MYPNDLYFDLVADRQREMIAAADAHRNRVVDRLRPALGRCPAGPGRRGPERRSPRRAGYGPDRAGARCRSLSLGLTTYRSGQTWPEFIPHRRNGAFQ